MAEAGRSSSDNVSVCSLVELQTSGRKLVTVAGRSIILFYHNQQIHALDSMCYHTGGPLHEGKLVDIEDQTCVVCPWHKYNVCLKTGESFYQSIDPSNLKKPPEWKSKGVKQRTHQAYIENEQVYVILSDITPSVDSDYYSSAEYKTLMAKTGHPS